MPSKPTPRPPLLAAAVLLFAAVCAASSGAAQTCTGDCNDNGNVSTPELAQAVRIALLELAFEACPSAAVDGVEPVEIDDLVVAVNQHLESCTFQ